MLPSSRPIQPTTRLTIGFDAKRAFFNTRGLGNYSRYLLNSLSQTFPAHQYILYSPRASIQIGEGSFQLQANMKVKAPQHFGQKLSGGSVWRSVFLGKQIKKDGVKIYHGLSNELPWNIQHSGAKSVVTIHDLIFMRHPEWYPFLDRKMYAFKWKNACQKADKIIAISEQTKQDIVHFLKIDPEKIEVIYQSCDPAFYDYQDGIFLQHGIFKKEDYASPYTLPKRYILSVGSITPRKNLLHTVKAFQVMKDKLDIDLVVVGTGKAYQKEVEQYVFENGLQSCVHFLGKVPQAYLPAIYRQALALFYPSLFEGFGIPIIEGLFSRIPVVTSKGSCFAEAGGPETQYIDPLDIEAIADTMEQVVTSGALRMQMIVKGWNYAQQFRGDVVAKRVMEIYRSL